MAETDFFFRQVVAAYATTTDHSPFPDFSKADDYHKKIKTVLNLSEVLTSPEVINSSTDSISVCLAHALLYSPARVVSKKS